MYLVGLLVSQTWAGCHLQNEAVVKAKRIINTIDQANRHRSKRAPQFTYLSNSYQFRHLFSKFTLMDGYKLQVPSGYRPSGSLLHFQKAKKVSTKTLICQQKAYLRRFMKNSTKSYLNFCIFFAKKILNLLRQAFCCIFRRLKKCQQKP